MTRPTRNRPASLFAATAADLPLFSGTCQRAEAQQHTPREQAQQDSMFDRRDYIQKPTKRTTEAKQQAALVAALYPHGPTCLKCDAPATQTGEGFVGLPLYYCDEHAAYYSKHGSRKLSALAPETNTEARQQLDD